MSVLNWVICIQRSSIFQIPSGLPFRFGYFFKPCPHAAAPSSPAVHTVSREPCTRVQDETPPAFLPPSLPGTHQSAWQSHGNKRKASVISHPAIHRLGDLLSAATEATFGNFPYRFNLVAVPAKVAAAPPEQSRFGALCISACRVPSSAEHWQKSPEQRGVKNKPGDESERDRKRWPGK